MKNLFIALFAMISFTAAAQDGGLELVSGEGATIEFVEEVLDYGTIENGSDGTRYFEFKNTGTEPLIISNCKGSCGCTVPQCPKEPILPGETGKIKVKYATDRVGAFTKNVTVTSNAVTPSKTVKIKGNVLPGEPAPAK
ncbi:MAG: DUF1573 domain-containing protein [Chitinophagales bacterium]